eukprot:10485366-Alexandrium_andersonii.AAC.1
MEEGHGQPGPGCLHALGAAGLLTARARASASGPLPSSGPSDPKAAREAAKAARAARHLLK